MLDSMFGGPTYLAEATQLQGGKRGLGSDGDEGSDGNEESDGSSKRKKQRVGA